VERTHADERRESALANGAGIEGSPPLDNARGDLSKVEGRE
jgi:hypothetical protein